MSYIQPYHILPYDTEYNEIAELKTALIFTILIEIEEVNLN